MYFLEHLRVPREGLGWRAGLRGGRWSPGSRAKPEAIGRLYFLSAQPDSAKAERNERPQSKRQEQARPDPDPRQGERQDRGRNRQ